MVRRSRNIDAVLTMTLVGDVADESVYPCVKVKKAPHMNALKCGPDDCCEERWANSTPDSICPRRELQRWPPLEDDDTGDECPQDSVTQKLKQWHCALTWWSARALPPPHLLENSKYGYELVLCRGASRKPFVFFFGALRPSTHTRHCFTQAPWTNFLMPLF
ncbi:hypothetical protein BDQ17DRAFT_1363010 [Cyathus striatus]|nr:hypothetical protein BDQ17DRAFT_1382173 [Cyathus striatus]KAF8997559.1 hypothetical protein BDQ17DRAFT_1363010 [Cyathus striatus]